MPFFTDNIRAGASGATTGYEIERSLRMDGSNGYLTRTPTSTGNRKIWTWSGWIKRTKLFNEDYIFSCNSQSGNDGIAALYWKSGNNRLQFYFDTSGANPYGDINTREYRDVGAWYHIVWQVDASNTTHRIWVNGVEENITGGQPPNYDFAMNRSGYAHAMGSQAWDGHTNRGDMYFAECHYSDGYKYEASDFGEINSDTGVWSPKEVNITYGTNGFYLKFDDNSNNTAATIGKDSSGNGNNWTPNGISVSAGVGNDSLEDTPTNNFCTISRLDSWRSSTEVEEGGLKFRRHSNNFGPARGTFAVKTGKWYFEFTKGSGLVQAGFVNTDHNLNYNGGDVGLNSSGSNPCGIAYDSRGYWYGYTGSNPSSISDDDIIGVAFDADNFKFYFHKNGTYYGSGNPSTGSNGIQPNASNTVTKTDDMMFAPYFNGENGNGHANFGQRPFVHSIPTGYQSLCSANLPDPTILLPNKYFNTLLWSGNGASSRAITGLDFQPDWVWLKSRTNTDYHQGHDSVRGISAGVLFINEPAPEDSNYPLDSFDSNGFTTSADASDQQNTNGQNYVAWNWEEDTTAGFDIVLHNLNSTGSDFTINHGLGVTPAAIFAKNRDANHSWRVFHQKIGVSQTEFLDDSGGVSGNANRVRAVSSSNFTFRTNSSGNFVFYVFSEVLGFSNFGSYKGNGDSNGTCVNTGFRPALIILKRTNSAASWVIHDDKRSGFNGDNDYLHPDNAQSESDGSSGTLDILSNGFKLRMTAGTHNGNGDNYIYFAFAQSSFKYSRAR